MRALGGTDDDAAFVCELALARMNDAIAHRRRPDRHEVQHLVAFCLGRSRTHMERELLITGIGGQGVQLAAQVLARAATLEGREVMYLGLYGGMMRGGNTDSTVVVADAPILAPPVVSQRVVGDRDARRVLAAGRGQAAARRARARQRRDVHERRSRADVTRAPRPATTVATDLGNPLGGSMVMLGAFCATTGIVGARRARRGDARVDPAVPHPAHRSQRTRAARRAGSSCPPSEFPAWERSAAHV